MAFIIEYIEACEGGERIRRQARGENTLPITICDRIADEIAIGLHGAATQTDGGSRWLVSFAGRNWYAYGYFQ